MAADAMMHARLRKNQHIKEVSVQKFFTLFFAIAALTGCVTAADPAFAESLSPVQFALSDVAAEGDPVFNSEAHLGKPILLDFYFASCPACNNNEPNVAAAIERFHGEDGQVVQVSIDCEREEWNRWIDRYDVVTPVLNDCARDLADALGVRSYPTTIVLRRDHTIAYRYVGTWSASARTRIYEEMSR
jgi:peroxiredoxin